MDIIKTLKSVMKKKKITQLDLASGTGKSPNTVRNILVRDSISTNTLIAYADILGCDVVLQDRETGEIYR